MGIQDNPKPWRNTILRNKPNFAVTGSKTKVRRKNKANLPAEVSGPYELGDTTSKNAKQSQFQQGNLHNAQDLASFRDDFSAKQTQSAQDKRL